MTSKNRFWRDGVLMNDEPVTDIDFIVKHALGTIDRHCNCTGNEMTVIEAAIRVAIAGATKRALAQPRDYAGDLVNDSEAGLIDQDDIS